MIVPQYVSSKITVFVRGKVTIVKSLTQVKLKLTLQLVIVVLNTYATFRDMLKFPQHPIK